MRPGPVLGARKLARGPTDTADRRATLISTPREHNLKLVACRLHMHARLYMHARSHTHSTCAGSWWGEWQHGAAPPHVEVNLEENEALQAAMVEDWADWEKYE